MIILKVTKKQGFTLSSEKVQVQGQVDSPTFSELIIYKKGNYQNIW